MTYKNTYKTIRSNFGFTLIEILVGMIISLLAVLAIFQAYASFEGRKRTIESANEAQLDGAFISTTLDRELRKAGYGFAHTAALGCATNFYNEDLALNKAYVQRLIPALITDGGSTAPDAVSIMAANNQALTPLILTANTQSNLDNSGAVTRKMKVKNTFGIRAGDYFLLSNIPGGVSFTEPTTSMCTFGQATTSAAGLGAVSATNGLFNNSELDRLSGPGPCEIGASDCNSGSKYNHPTSFVPIEYKQQTSGVLPLGSLTRETFAVKVTGQNYRLEQTSSANAAAGSAAEVASGIVNLQAQYGIDSNGDDAIDSWVEPTGTWASSRINNTTQNAAEIKDIWKIKALRIAVVARANLLEKNGSCPSLGSSVTITWPSGPAMNAAIPANPAGNCYRYQISKINVALKNVLWSAAGDN